jgi:hypothetical protein
MLLWGGGVITGEVEVA